MIATFKYTSTDSLNNLIEEDVTGKINKIFKRHKITPADTEYVSLYMTIGLVDYEIKPTSSITFYTKKNDLVTLQPNTGGFSLNGTIYPTVESLYNQLTLMYKNEHIVGDKDND